MGIKQQWLGAGYQFQTPREYSKGANEEAVSRQERQMIASWPDAAMSNAQELLSKAAKKESSSSSGFASFFGGGSSTTKFEEARDLYVSAANAFKLEKSFKDSGDAFIRAGDCAVKAIEKDDAANDYWNAAKAYKKTHPERPFVLQLFSACCA